MSTAVVCVAPHNKKTRGRGVLSNVCQEQAVNGCGSSDVYLTLLADGQAGIEQARLVGPASKSPSPREGGDSSSPAERGTIGPSATFAKMLRSEGGRVSPMALRRPTHSLGRSICGSCRGSPPGRL